MISVLKGDITRLDFDIIVNAANSALMPGGGVCGAIFSRAGQGLLKECISLNGCQTGQAKMTLAYDLPSKRIIHAVGPRYIDGKHNEKELLAACYWNSMSLAYDYLLESKQERIAIAFPCIATGIYGYPNQEACKIACDTIQALYKAYPDAKAIDVTFVCYLEIDYAYYKEYLGIR